MDLGLFVLRLVGGGLFVRYGAQRLGRDGARQPEPVSTAHAAPVRGGWPTTLVAALELGGGVLLVLGLLTFFAALFVSAAVMTGVLVAATRRGVRADELTLLLLAVPFALAAVGPGSWSLDHELGFHWIGAGWALLELGIAWVAATAAAVAAGRDQPGTAGGGPARAA